MAENPASLIAAARAQRAAGRLADAIRLQQRAVSQMSRTEDPAAYAHAARHLADMHSDAGDVATAEPLYADALSFYAPLRTLDAANAIRGAALNAERLGERDRAEALWQEAKARYLALDAVLSERTRGNPGVAEAEVHLAAL